MTDETREPRGGPDVRISRWMWVADAVIVLLLAVAAWVATFSGWLWTIGPIALSVRSPQRLVSVAIVVAALTWVAQRAVPPWVRWRRRVEAFERRFPVGAAVLPVVIGSRAMVLLAGLMAVKLIGFPSTYDFSTDIFPHDLVNLPYRWDTTWYTGIALYGYRWNPDPQVEQTIVFFPAFPILMRLGATLLMMASSPVAVVWSGVAIAWASFTWACVYIYRMARDEFGDTVAMSAIILLSAYPFAAFYSTAYSEGLFLLVNVAAFCHFRRGELLPAALFGLIAGMTRPNGCLLSVVLAAVWFFGEWAPNTPEARREPLALTLRGAVRALAVASMPGIGLLIYSAFLWHLTGEPLAWLNRQQAWHRDVHLGDPRLAMQFHMARHWLDVVALFLVTCSLWPMARRLGYGAACFAGASTLIPFLNGGLLSVGRFTSIAFPLFIWLALAIPERRRPLVATVFAILQGLVASVFFTGRPLY